MKPPLLALLVVLGASGLVVTSWLYLRMEEKRMDREFLKTDWRTYREPRWMDRP